MIRDGRVKCDGFVIGSGRKKGNTSPSAAHAHNGIVIGGSVKSKRGTTAKSSIDRLSSGRNDGKIL